MLLLQRELFQRRGEGGGGRDSWMDLCMGEEERERERGGKKKKC